MPDTTATPAAADTILTHPVTESEVTRWLDLHEGDDGADDALHEEILSVYGEHRGAVLWAHAVHDTRYATAVRRMIADLTASIGAAQNVVASAAQQLDKLTVDLGYRQYYAAAGDLSAFLSEARRALVAAAAINAVTSARADGTL